GGSPQVPQASSGTTGSGSTTVLYSADDDYRIGLGDVLQINVQDAPELSGNFRVGKGGTILVPFLGRLTALGATPEELQKQIADGLRGQYLVDPQVAVVVTQYTSRTLFIQGAVRSPGVYQIEGRPNLLMLITMAGGLVEDHGSTAFIIHQVKSFGSDDQHGGEDKQGGSRPRSVANTKPAASTSGPSTANDESSINGDGSYELRSVNINGLLRGNFSQNVVIEPGDIINIPPTDVFFVAGEVHSPGSFPLKEGTTLRQAISLAQGMTFRASPSKGIIFREDPKTGKREEVKVSINEVMAGKKPDVPIIANDIIIVPNSAFKSVGGTLLSAFGVNAARVPIAY
ncbi:MAG TPA: polysaccharide biosynthesis/export family protein, partial [Blastocatellia bacterium]|nr:polysaccharide biosynthesis/export family protein [Blastocatellia bacterium]